MQIPSIFRFALFGMAIITIGCSDSGEIVNDDRSPIADVPDTYQELDSLVSTNRLVAKDQVTPVRDYEVSALKVKAIKALNSGKDTSIARKNLKLFRTIEKENLKNQDILSAGLYQPNMINKLEHVANFEASPGETYLVKVNKINRDKYLDPILPAELAELDRYEAYYLNMLPKRGEVRPIGVQVYDDDFAASYLILLDRDGEMVDHLKLAGGLQAGAPYPLEGKYTVGWDDRYDADIKENGQIVLSTKKSKSVNDDNDAETEVEEIITTYDITEQGKFQKVNEETKNYIAKAPLWY
jgi:hypothetical protein